VRFLADESCDFAVVTALRAAGHEVSAIVETNRGAEDEVVLSIARVEERILLTEDKDFGSLAFASGHKTGGVVLIRFPANARRTLGQAVTDMARRFGDRLTGAFTVVEPGRVRLSRTLSDR
jgi:predicted nuclease of predicted toxin-antitoxin system